MRSPPLDPSPDRHPHPPSNKNLMYRDPNGFRKLIVALTSAGKALALHNGDGRVVWAARYDPAAPPTHLLRWRRFHDLAHSPQLALARAGAAAAGADAATDEARAARRSYASVLDGGTGLELDRIEVGGDVDKVRSQIASDRFRASLQIA